MSKSALTKCTFSICIIGDLLQQMEVLELKLEYAVVITCNSTDQVNDLKKDIDLQLKNHLKEIFDCMICRQLSKSPISIATCCKQNAGIEGPVHTADQKYIKL